jgi:hypothetical protein
MQVDVRGCRRCMIRRRRNSSGGWTRHLASPFVISDL